jgi:biotin transport system substrate-specific component
MLTRYWKWHSDAQRDFLYKLIFSVLLACTVGPVIVTLRDELPVTLQTLVLLFSAICFGWQIGGITAVLYILFGAAGLPVFAGYEGGLDYLTGVRGGFFFGFVFATIIVGFLSEHPIWEKAVMAFLLWIIGHAIIVAAGAIWVRSVDPEGWWTVVQTVFPGAMVKSAIGFLVVQLLMRWRKGRGAFYGN